MTPTTFGQLFQPYTFTLRAFALKLTRDKVDADDLYQDTLCKAIRYQHQYQPKTNLQAWLMTIMRNTFINEWRRRRRYLQVQQQAIPGVTVAASGVENNNGEQSLIMQELTQAIDLLEEGQRQPFLLAYQGYKYEEIATEMDLPVGTVKSRIHQARKALKKKLRRWYNGHSLQEMLD
jgi:RNA polymerase sigma-70 factor, ECF subfamily